MKIGLISINMYSKKLNFACPLHTFAFQQFLLKNGIESTVINYKPVYYNNFDLYHPYEYYKQKCEKLLRSGSDTEYIRRKIEEFSVKRDNYKKMYREREVRYKKFQKFIDENYIKTDKVYDSDLLEVCDPGFDCYICVTDVIWKNEPGEGFDRGFFLASSCMENKWKISYAASRGVHFSDSRESETEFLYYIDDIDYISVREKSLKEYIENNSCKPATLVLDPVLLNDREFYMHFAVKPEEEKYILLYYVVERATDTIQMAVEYAEKHDVMLVELTDFPDAGRLDKYEGIKKIYRYDIGIEEWLGYILHAECIFTNSFHGSCFSILFEKKFFVGRRNGDKLSNLLEMFGLEERRVADYHELISRKDIDYREVRDKLEKGRALSKQFVLDAIEKCSKRTKISKDYDWWKRAQMYPLIYHSGGVLSRVSPEQYEKENKKIEILHSGNTQYYPEENMINNGYGKFENCGFIFPGHKFLGWRIRFRIDKKWFWYMKNGKIISKEMLSGAKAGNYRYFKEGDRIPFFPVNHISVMVAEAGWVPEEYALIYNCGKSTKKFDVLYDTKEGEIIELPSGATEYKPVRKTENNSDARFLKNGFVLKDYIFEGWRIRIKNRSKWYWYLSDGSLFPAEDADKTRSLKLKYFRDEDFIPCITLKDFDTIVAEAVWKKYNYKMYYNSGMKLDKCIYDYNSRTGQIIYLSSGTTEYRPFRMAENSGKSRFEKNRFAYRGFEFCGWRMRIKCKNEWYWQLDDGKLIRKEMYEECPGNYTLRVFQDESFIPVISLEEIDLAVAEAVWTDKRNRLIKKRDLLVKKIFG